MECNASSFLFIDGMNRTLYIYVYLYNFVYIYTYTACFFYKLMCTLDYANLLSHDGFNMVQLVHEIYFTYAC